MQIKQFYANKDVKKIKKLEIECEKKKTERKKEWRKKRKKKTFWLSPWKLL